MFKGEEHEQVYYRRESLQSNYGRMRPDRVPLFLWGDFRVCRSDGRCLIIRGNPGRPYGKSAVIDSSKGIDNGFGWSADFEYSVLDYSDCLALKKSQVIFATFIAILFSVETYLFYFTAADTANVPRYFFNTAFALMAGGFILLILSI